MNKKETIKKETNQNIVKTQGQTSEHAKPRFTPRRFSVRGLRRHTGIQTSRTPRVAF